jgi:hypothetical protein
VIFRIKLVQACHFEAALKAADEGDKDAQRFMLAFWRWSEQVEGETPACFSCGAWVGPVTWCHLSVQ